MFPIKYIEENLVFNKENECWAYYELEPYNYSFLSEDKKLGIFREIKKLISQNHDGDIHALYITTEESIRDIQERSKKLIRSEGELKELAFDHMDMQTEVLINANGENENKVKYFIGFKLSNKEDMFQDGDFVAVLVKKIKEFFRRASKQLFDDVTIFDAKELDRYVAIEDMLENRISKRFRFRRLNQKDFGYIVEHIFGLESIAYDDYEYAIKSVKEGTNVQFKKYDLLKLTDVGIEEEKRYIKLQHGDNLQYVAVLTVSELTGELSFPGNEVLYLQQENFDFPVDVSENIETIGNRSALKTVRNKKKELDDLDDNAQEAGTSSSGQVYDAIEEAEELEDILDSTKESMYKLSYLIRVSASSKEELEKRVTTVRDFYSDYNMILQRPYGDQLGLLHEFVPSSKRYLDDYIQYATSDFIALLGFGSSRFIGEELGFPIGYDVATGQTVRIRPELAAQGVKGAVTNALAKAFIGSLGGGKSQAENTITVNSVLWGAESLMLDPKTERDNWKEDIPWLAPYINNINFTAEEKNNGILDPLVIIEDKKSAERLALDILTYLTGISIQDSARFPLLKGHISRAVTKHGGMLTVIKELRNTNTKESLELAEHIESFSELSFASLLFSNGTASRKIKLDKEINIFGSEELVLPDEETEPDKYTPSEMLTVAMMLVFSHLGLIFIRSGNNVFKIVTLEEAWSYMQFPQGKVLTGKMIREGRSKNSATDIVTQNTDDIAGEKMKNNIGLKFAFKSTDKVEVEKTLKFFNLEFTDENAETLATLENGQCLFQDLYGNVSVIQIDSMSDELDHAFDTRPNMEQEDYEDDYEDYYEGEEYEEEEI
ncbi:ATP-binding protein [Isobaculum melis]|uniref:AAA-like domain-containing protein n=1 Tax=Isobaculum melis TaxID=142588 RepID=A0A1H9TP53_9LACT|nr:ATP-binding protein [Isobaculum melis]SER99120.1 AAA-like domain-containing protein [Isobaculum melis]